MTPSTETVLGQFLEPVFRAMPASTAMEIANLKAGETLQSRVEHLARRANEGELTEAEKVEYQSFIDAGDILATLQALARRTLRTPSR